MSRLVTGLALAFAAPALAQESPYTPVLDRYTNVSGTPRAASIRICVSITLSRHTGSGAASAPSRSVLAAAWISTSARAWRRDSRRRWTEPASMLRCGSGRKLRVGQSAWSALPNWPLAPVRTMFMPS